MQFYLIHEDGFAAYNETILSVVADKKRNGWAVSDLLAVRVIGQPDGSYQETTTPNAGLRAAKIILK